MKGLTEHQAWKLLDFMYGYTGDTEWEREMVASLTEPELDESMEWLVVRYKARRKDNYRRQAKKVER